MFQRVLFSMGLAGALTLAPFAARAADDSASLGYTTRSIVRAGVDRGGRVHGELAKLTGLAKATSLNYKVLLLEPNGTERFVDEKTYVFKFGDQFRLAIEADTDMYLYVFHEGPDALRTVLLPDAVDKGYIPLVKAGEKKVIPDDGTYFEFAPPPGREKLLVFATPDKRPELTPKEAFDSKEKNDKKTIELKSKQDEVFMSSTSSNLKAETQADIKKVVQNAQQQPEFRLRGVLWTPTPATPEEGKTVLVGSFDEKAKPEIFVEIALQTK